MLKHIARYSRLIGIILFVIIIAKIDWIKTLTMVRKVDIGIFIFAISLFPLFVLFKAIRWHILLGSQGIDYPLKSCFIVYLSSNFLGVLTPSRIGEMSKVFYLKQERNLSYSRGFSSVIVDRLFDIFVLFVTACIGVFSVFKDFRYFTASMLLFVAAVIILIGINMGRIDTILKNFLYAINRRKTYRMIKVFYLSFVSLNCRTLFYCLGVSIFGITVYFLICHLLAYSLHLKQDSILLIPFSISIANLVSLIPVSISGIGLRDLALIVILGKAGFSPEIAMSFSILFLFYFTGLWTLLGWMAWSIKPIPISKDKLKE